MKNNMKLLHPILLSLLILILNTACHHQAEKEEEKPVLTVTSPLKKDTSVSREYVAQIHSIRRIEMRSLERGYLQKIFVDEGQRVRKGQLMFKITPNILRAELNKNQAEAKTAEIEYQNTKMLAESNIVSKNELAITKSKLDKARAEVALAQTHLNFTDIRAPFSGIMDHLQAREGSLLDEGAALTTLSDNSKMWVYFNVSEAEYLNYITSKDKQNRKKVKLRMANGDMFKYDGKIETIEAEFDNKTGNIELRATFPNPEGILRHGETGNIVMSTPFKNALMIPQSATFEILDKKYIFVIDEHNKVTQRPIEVAEELPHLYILKAGLAPKERILLEGLRKVHNGEEIATRYEEPSKIYAHLDIHAE
jgi:membrane fusion protein, multidrug efflux system